jgi:hypothetical protein
MLFACFDLTCSCVMIGTLTAGQFGIFGTSASFSPALRFFVLPNTVANSCMCVCCVLCCADSFMSAVGAKKFHFHNPADDKKHAAPAKPAAAPAPAAKPAAAAAPAPAAAAAPAKKH